MDLYSYDIPLSFVHCVPSSFFFFFLLPSFSSYEVTGSTGNSIDSSDSVLPSIPPSFPLSSLYYYLAPHLVHTSTYLAHASATYEYTDMASKEFHSCVHWVCEWMSVWVSVSILWLRLLLSQLLAFDLADTMYTNGYVLHVIAAMIM